jgi:hypothetical protein
LLAGGDSGRANIVAALKKMGGEEGFSGEGVPRPKLEDDGARPLYPTPAHDTELDSADA